MAQSSKLPIAINADQTLVQEQALTASMLEKLEAWANFSSLKANWYGDESKVISINITWVKEQFFTEHFTELNSNNWQVNTTDKVAQSLANNGLRRKVFIALTQDEASPTEGLKQGKWLGNALEQQIQIQLLKLLNDIAIDLDLDPLVTD